METTEKLPADSEELFYTEPSIASSSGHTKASEETVENTNIAPEIHSEELFNTEEDQTEKPQSEVNAGTPDNEVQGDIVEDDENDEMPDNEEEIQDDQMESEPVQEVAGSSKPPSKEARLVQLPLGRIKHIMKLDPDLKLASAESICLVTKATELFISTLAKECVIQKDPKKKTIQKKDVDKVFSSIESLQFLDGAMEPFAV